VLHPAGFFLHPYWQVGEFAAVRLCAPKT
jgi:hypothetical protein